MPKINFPEYLYKKTSKFSSQISPHAPLNPVKAIDDKQAFESIFSPNQQPQKKQIFLDYNTFYRLLNKEKRALIIAKLKAEGFSVSFILQKSNSDQLLIAEIDQDLNIQIGSQRENIFLLSDQDIEKLSKINRGQAIDKLSLAVDDSIILDFAQFQEIDDILSVNSWVKQDVYQSHLSFHYYQTNLNKSEYRNGFTSFESFYHQNDLQTYLALPDFDVEDEKIKSMLNRAKNEINKSYIRELSKGNPENFVKIFDYWFDSSFENDQEKIDFQKSLVELFWFFHPDLSHLISKARTIRGYEDKDIKALTEEFKIYPHLLWSIARELSSKTFRSRVFDIGDSKKLKIKSHTSGTSQEICKIEEYFLHDNFISSILEQPDNQYTDTLFDYLMFLKKINSKITFNTEFFCNKRESARITINYNNIDYQITGFSNQGFFQLINDPRFRNEFDLDKINESLYQQFLESHNPQDPFKSEINFFDLASIFDHLTPKSQKELIKKFQALIDNGLELINSRNNPIDSSYLKDIEKLTFQLSLISSLSIYKELRVNEYLSALINVINEYDDDSQISIIMQFSKMINPLIDNDEIKQLIKKMICGCKNSIYLLYSYPDHSPELLDFFLTLHYSGVINLSKYEESRKYFDNIDSIKGIFTSNLLNPEDLMACCHLDEIKFFSIKEYVQVSPTQHNQSPIQICLLDFDQKTLDDLVSLITKGKIDPSKILSLKILRFNQLPQEPQDISSEELEQNLLNRVIQLFPNLKHLKFNKDALHIAQINDALRGKKIVYEAIDYSLPQTNSQKQNYHGFICFDEQQNSEIFIRTKYNTSEALMTNNNFINVLVQLGIIIHRPAIRKHKLLVRTSLNQLKDDNQTLNADWLPEILSTGHLQEIPRIEKYLSKEQITSYDPPAELKETHTFTLFNQDLVRGQNMLPSISVDNEIVGYYTDPNNAVIEFHKNAEGFFFATCEQKCQITYILKGKELPSHTFKDVNLDNLPDQIKQVIRDYERSITDLKSISQLPPYPNDQSLDFVRKNRDWLDRIFCTTNKGSCRHRVMAFANKFQQLGLQNGKDFRIAGINNNHVLLEIKNKDQQWITLDLGGLHSKTIKQSGTYSVLPENLKKMKQAILIHEISPEHSSPQSQKTSINPDTSPSLSQAQVIDYKLEIVQTKIDELYQLKELTSIDDFKELLLTFILGQQKSILLTSQIIEELKNYLLSFTKSKDWIRTHFISSPQDMQIKKTNIQIQANGKVLISSISLLSQFINSANSAPEKQHLLIIDWQKFDDKNRVAFNTMFNQSQRTINGVVIPNNLKIICLDDARSEITDPSVLSRFDDAYDLSVIEEEDLVSYQVISKISRIFEFDGHGEENWQAKLFGKLVVNRQSIEFKKSDFVMDLEDQENNIDFKFKNFSTKQQDEIAKLFAQAQAQGFIDYHGYKINFPRNYSLKFDRTEFNFAEVLQGFKSLGDSGSKLTLAIHPNAGQIESDAIVINSHLFDQLLVLPEISGDKYIENPGLIESAKGQTLKLFITQQLTPAQLYCILYHAKNYQVNLEFYLAKGFKLEDQAFMKFQKALETSVEARPDVAIPDNFPSRITITNNVELEFDQLEQLLSTSTNHQDKSINIVNIEDVLFSDLFSQPKYIFNQGDQAKHITFEQKISEVKSKLDKGKIVVLKGIFPDDLLSLLHPQILDLKAQYPNLYFIIKEEISSTSEVSTKLAWLDRSKYAIRYHPNQAVKESVSETERIACINSKISDDSPQEAIDFIKIRKAKLKELLSKNTALQIIGHSGVGKSSLLREVKKTGFDSPGDSSITEELANFEQWANDTSARTKILVIDEFNVDGSTNYTMFRDFVNAQDDSRKKIFYQGKFYQLDQHHKVVFLGNPHNYGNRHKHQLFSDCQIQEWQLKDFSQSYIYQKILKEPIFDGLSDDIKSRLNEEEFKKLSAEAIRKYYQNNTKKSDDESDLPNETVRELQERVLQEIVKKFTTLPETEVASQNFISTQVNQQTIRDLQIAIKIRKLQKQEQFPGECIGTPGVILEGNSGVGKSVMIEAVLQNQGITALSSLDDLASDDRAHHYFKIDANSPYQKIKEQLFKAFELGVIVVIDELNTRINEGLEREINALLTGLHPNKPETKMKPGFMIITSINKASSAGRSNFSPAIKHRCTNISALPLSAYQVEDFSEIIFDWAKKDPKIKKNLSKKIVNEIAPKFRQLVNKDSKYNLRSLKIKFNEIKSQLCLTENKSTCTIS